MTSTRLAVYDPLPHLGTKPRLVVIKTVLDRPRFNAEVRWLTRFRHLSVAQLAYVEPEHGVYATYYVGGPTLATLAATPAKAKPVLMALTDLLAELHRNEAGHGALSLDHILVAAQRPVLVSPNPSGDDTRACDVEQLASMLRNLAALWRATDAVEDAISDRWTEAAQALTGADGPTARKLRRLVGELPVGPRSGFRASWRRRCE